VNLVLALRTWQQRKPTSELWVLHEPGRSLVWDSRTWDGTSPPPHLIALEGLEHVLLAELDGIRGFRDLVRIAAVAAGDSQSPDAVRRALDHLDKRGLVVREGDRYLGLAVLASSDKQRARLLECARGDAGSAAAGV
jgi:hypothetical protein